MVTTRYNGLSLTCSLLADGGTVRTYLPAALRRAMDRVRSGCRPLPGQPGAVVCPPVRVWPRPVSSELGSGSAKLVDVLHCLAEVCQPRLGVLADQLDRPRQRLGAGPCHAGVDQGVEHPTLGLT